MTSAPPPTPPPSAPPPALAARSIERPQGFAEALSQAVAAAHNIQGQHSVCRRSRRGAAFWRHSQGTLTIAAGTNQRADRRTCDASDACKATCRQTCIHAEQHALTRAAWSGMLLSGVEGLHVKVAADTGELMASGQPSCMECAKLMRHFGVAHFWLFHGAEGGGWHRYTIQDFLDRTQQTLNLYRPAVRP